MSNITEETEIIVLLKSKFKEYYKKSKSRTVSLIFLCDQIHFDEVLRRQVNHQYGDSKHSAFEQFFEWLLSDDQINLSEEELKSDVFGKTALIEINISILKKYSTWRGKNLLKRTTLIGDPLLRSKLLEFLLDEP